MDPNATLICARNMVRAIFAGYERTNPNSPDVQLAEAFDALDGWLRRGGVLPDDWQRKRKRGRKPRRLACPACGRSVRLRADDTMELHHQKGASQASGVFPCDAGGTVPAQEV